MAKAKPVTGLDVHAPVAKNADIIARTRLEEMYEWSQHIDNPYEVHNLHNLRIAAKRLRYTLELFEDVLPEESKAVVEELKGFSSALVSVAGAVFSPSDSRSVDRIKKR